MVIFQNGVTFASGESDLLKPELQALFDENLVSAEYPEGLVSAMGYVKTKVQNSKGEFASSFGTPEMSKIKEGEALPAMPTGKSNGKGFKVEEYGNTIPVSKLMADWLKVSQTLQGADSTVRQEFQNFAENYRALRNSAAKAENNDATRVFASAWTGTNAYGFGSPTENGQALLANNHPINKNLAGVITTFRNVLGGGYGTEDAALSATSLQNMLNMQKSELQTYVGDRISIPSAYVLMCGRRLATTARQILNTPGTQVGTYSGTGSNAMQLNQFDFTGNKVALLEHPILGGDVGTDDMFFLINTEALARAKALKHFVLNEGEVDMREDKTTKTTLISYYKSAGFDHYGAERFVVGSKGTA